MLARSTTIGILALILTGCGLAPQIKPHDKVQLEALKGPEVTGIEATLLEQAHQAESKNDFLSAEETYKQLIDKYPNNQDYMLAFANDLRRSGDNDSSMMLEEKVLKKDPHSTSALEAKALTLMNKGEFKDAGDTFGEVMKIDPKRWRTLNGIGILFAMKNRNSDAMAYYNSALELNANSPSVMNNMALGYAMDKDYDKAIETFMRAKAHLPESSSEVASIDMNMALVYAISGKLDEAEHVASSHLNKSALYNNMGFYSYLAKNNDLAKGYLNMALTQSPVYYERAWKNLNAMSNETSTNAESVSGSGSGLRKPETKAGAAQPVQKSGVKTKKKLKMQMDDDDAENVIPEPKKLPLVSVTPDLSMKLGDIPPPRTVDLGPFPATQIQKSGDTERKSVPTDGRGKDDN